MNAGCQRLDYFFPSTKPGTVLPTALPTWNHKDDDTEGFHRSFAASSIAEAQRNMMSFGGPTVGLGCAQSSRPTDEIALLLQESTGALDDLRQSLMFFGMVVEEQKSDRRCLAMQDPANKSGFCFRIVDVRTVRDPAAKASNGSSPTGYPLLVILYKFDIGGELSQASDSIRWLGRITRQMRLNRFRRITAGQDEQHLLLKLLELNSSLLATSYSVNRWTEESGFKLSFLLPCMPLNAPLLARCQFPAHCANECQKEATSICGGCGVVHYCSPGTSWSPAPSHLVRR